MSEKQDAEMLDLADRIRDIAYSGVNNFDDFSSYKLDLIQDYAKLLQASLAAPSPHPRGEPVAWQTAKVSIDVSTCDADAGRRVFGRVVDWQPEDFDGEKPLGLRLLCEYESDNFGLRAAPPPAGADAARAATDQLCVVEADLNCLHAIVKQACDLLSEKTNGSAARLPAHNARLLLERAMASIPAPQPQEKPTGDQT